MKYRIPVIYTVFGNVEIEAKNQKEAIKLAYNCGTTDVKDKEYLHDSFVIYSEDIEEIDE